MGHSWLGDERRQSARCWGLCLLLVIPFVVGSVVLTVLVLR